MVLEMKYEVKKMVFESFDTMIEDAFRIEDVLRDQDILTKNGNNNNNGQNKKNNNKDKGKNTYWNKKKQVVNDGVLDSSKPNNQAVLCLASDNQQGYKPRYQDAPN